jgi:hypothetical protein
LAQITKIDTLQDVRRKSRQPSQQSLRQQTKFPPDGPMADFIDWRLAPLTKQQYIIRLKMFFDYLGLKGSLDKQSTEFLVRARKDIEWAEKGLKYFIREKKSKVDEGQLAEASIRNFYKPVRLFCKVHKITLSWDMITMTIPTGRRFANDRAPTKEEVEKIIEYPDRRIGPIVLVSCSSGIRVGAWEYLRWKHIEPIQRDGKVIAAKITVYAGENEQYYSFMTPEAFQSLQEWMDYRKRCGEEVTGESWVMRTLWNTTDPKSDVKVTNKMGFAAIRALVERALKAQGLRTGIAKVAHRHEFKTNHGFRKFFQTNCEPKMKSLDVMTLMGQNTGLAASYNKPTVEMLLNEYLKAVDNLTIDKVQTDEEVIKNQQALAAEMQTKDKEIQELKEQMAKMSDLVEKLNSAISFYKPVFVSEMQRLNPHLDPSGFEISPFADETTNFLRRRGMKETSTTQG